MVRLGIGLYGIDPFTNQIIHNVSTLKTTILQIHEVPKEETVGYSRKGHLERDSRIAAIPIGYADGLNRRLGNGHAYCLVNGSLLPELTKKRTKEKDLKRMNIRYFCVSLGSY